jgi:hypothetical protein
MVRPKKEKGSARDKLLQVRLRGAEYVEFQTAAEMSGLDLSAWVRERLLIAARREGAPAQQKRRPGRAAG